MATEIKIRGQKPIILRGYTSAAKEVPKFAKKFQQITALGKLIV